MLREKLFLGFGGQKTGDRNRLNSYFPSTRVILNSRY